MSEKFNLENIIVNESEQSPEIFEDKQTASYELRDDQGKVRCTVNMEYTVEIEKGSAKRVDKLVVESENVSYNLFDLPGIRKDEPVYIRENGGYEYDPIEKEVFIPEPSNLFNLYVALHELGHEVQFGEEVYRNLGQSIMDDKITLLMDPLVEYMRNQAMEYAVYKEVPPDVLEQLSKLSKEYKTAEEDGKEKVLDSSMLETAWECEKCINAMISELSESTRGKITHLVFGIEKGHELWDDIVWKRKLNVINHLVSQNIIEQEFVDTLSAALAVPVKDFEKSYQPYKQNQDLKSRLQDEFMAIYNEHRLPLDKLVVAIPLASLERDATKRAFRWILSLKHEHGINLQFPIKLGFKDTIKSMGISLTEEQMDHIDKGNFNQVAKGDDLQYIQEQCSQDKVSARNLLMAGLRSYKADSKSMRNIFRTKN